MCVDRSVHVQKYVPQHHSESHMPETFSYWSEERKVMESQGETITPGHFSISS